MCQQKILENGLIFSEDMDSDKEGRFLDTVGVY